LQTKALLSGSDTVFNTAQAQKGTNWLKDITDGIIADAQIIFTPPGRKKNHGYEPKSKLWKQIPQQAAVC